MTRTIDMTARRAGHVGASLMNIPVRAATPVPDAAPPPDKLTVADVAAAEATAHAAYKLLANGVAERRLPALRLLDEIWNHYGAQRPATGDLPARLKRAVALRRCLDALGALPTEVWHTLTEQQAVQYPVRGIEAARAALAADPVLSAFRTEADQAQAARQAANEAVAAQEAARYPAILLARLRRAGVALALNDADQITAPANTVLSPQDRRELVHHAAGVAALLKAEQQAAEPAPIVLV